MAALNRTEKLKYIGVEMLKKDATKSSVPEVGLFRGLRERSSNTDNNNQTIKLILLGVKDKENDLRALNLDVFNVLSIKMLYGKTKELIVCKNNDADQEAAIEILTAALEEFQADKRMVNNDPEIIDTGTFEEVSSEFFAPKAADTAAGGTNYGYNGSAYSGNNSDWQAKQKEREEQKAKEEEMRWTPFIIKRKGELPGIKILNAVKKKVLALASNEYDEPLKDPDPKDTFTEGKKTATA